MSKPILRIWDEESQDYIPIPAIKGPKGDTGPQGESAADAVKYTSQELTDQQKSQARENIGAVGAEDVLQPDWAQNDATAKDYVKNRPGGYWKTEEETITVNTATGVVEGFGFIPAVAGDSLEVTVDGVVKEYIAATGPINPDDPNPVEYLYIGQNPADGENVTEPFTLYFISYSYTLVPTDWDNPHTISFKIRPPAKFGMQFMPDDVLPKLQFIPNHGETEEELKGAVAYATYVKNVKLEERVVVDFDADHGRLCVRGPFARYAGLENTSLKMNSALDSQTIKDVATTFTEGIAKLDVVDTVNYKRYTVFFYSDIVATTTIVDGYSAIYSTQALAYINGKIFSFCINDASGGGRFLNGDLTIKRIDIPTALKNPSALTIKIGSETVTYDGSAAKTVEIADGTEVSY